MGLYQWLDFLEKNAALETLTQPHWNGKRGELWQYRFVSHVPLRNGNHALSVNWFELIITDEKMVLNSLPSLPKPVSDLELLEIHLCS